MCFTGCKGEADVIFLIDASDLVTRQEFEDSRQFVREATEWLDISVSETQVGVGLIADYTGVSAIYLDRYSDKTRLLNAIDAIDYVGTPGNLSSSLGNVRGDMFIDVNGARNNIPRILVFVTSDERDFNNAAMVLEAERLKDEQIELISFVYGKSRDADTVKEELNQIVSRPVADNQFRVDRADSLTRTHSEKTKFKRELCLDIPGMAIL